MCGPTSPLSLGPSPKEQPSLAVDVSGLAYGFVCLFF